ncbi:MAG: ExsB family transcriptional regulator [Planctomycetes bacterium]|jgi:GMP synthase (glutamine-hydrolysing)|nr:ExsB family transcriptional regulator [Planctomycetota bacterium]
MAPREIRVEDLDTEKFIREKGEEMARVVGDGRAINALSGGVDSSAVTVLAHRALGARIETVFIENGLMREGESGSVVATFAGLGIPVRVIDARARFFAALAGLTDPEDKRNAITKTFYSTVFGPLVRDSGATFLLHGTILTDVEETVAGIKRQHNILAQLGIDPEKAYGYRVLEPLIELRKPAVRKLARALGLPASVYARPPFPGPALAARVIGEVTPEDVALVRAATTIVEAELSGFGAFQCMAILHGERVPGMRHGRREYGRQIEVRCWDTADAVSARPTAVPFATLVRLGERISSEVPGVVSVTYNVTAKPPSTMEAV